MTRELESPTTLFACVGLSPASPELVVPASDWVDAAQRYQLLGSPRPFGHVFACRSAPPEVRRACGSWRYDVNEHIAVARVQVRPPSGEAHATLVRAFFKTIVRAGGVPPSRDKFDKFIRAVGWEDPPHELFGEWDAEGDWQTSNGEDP